MKAHDHSGPVVHDHSGWVVVFDDVPLWIMVHTFFGHIIFYWLFVVLSIQGFPESFLLCTAPSCLS